MRSSPCVTFFFFQAEDGIRAYKVTGVQTCALPIFGFEHERPAARAAALQALIVTGAGGLALLAAGVLLVDVSGTEIGRASCRERVWIAEGAGGVRKTNGRVAEKVDEERSEGAQRVW